MKVSVDGVDYTLDVDKAMNLKILTKPFPSVKLGDIYKARTSSNVVMVVQPFFNEPYKYQLVTFGMKPFSDDFYRTLHTLEEIRERLMEKGYDFVKNVTLRDIYDLVK